jgi:hypothetical protein
LAPEFEYFDRGPAPDSLLTLFIFFGAPEHLLQIVFKGSGVGGCQPGLAVKVSQMGDFSLNTPAHKRSDQVPLRLSQGGHKIIQPFTFITQIGANLLQFSSPLGGIELPTTMLIISITILNSIDWQGSIQVAGRHTKIQF